MNRGVRLVKNDNPRNPRSLGTSILSSGQWPGQDAHIHPSNQGLQELVHRVWIVKSLPIFDVHQSQCEMQAVRVSEQVRTLPLVYWP